LKISAGNKDFFKAVVSNHLAQQMKDASSTLPGRDLTQTVKIRTENQRGKKKKTRLFDLG